MVGCRLGGAERAADRVSRGALPGWPIPALRGQQFGRNPDSVAVFLTLIPTIISVADADTYGVIHNSGDKSFNYFTAVELTRKLVAVGWKFGFRCRSD